MVVTTGGGTAAPLGYTYLPDGSGATVTGLTPTSGPTSGGTTVTITGTGFTAATGVTFDGVPGTGFTVNPAGTNLVVNPNGTSLTVVTPPGSPGAVDVTVLLPGDDVTAPDGFTYEPVPPRIDTVSPGQGPTGGGTTVTVSGSGFVPGGTTVTIRATTIPASRSRWHRTVARRPSVRRPARPVTPLSW
ncbi:IPT/TIG domain-containing protein [Micromonospora sp. RL09-050-HVF-A]|uniref:IPT/TIG domain-containing protein n=1 Tax=unclassified Micromonospora TaxID=2617518 RepID=UPI001C5EA0FD|nr:IPT/TIG domain-containing protein [Micromonospora sp. RL09-050-HVF-A]MBW4700461.1 IPT/TIG domain-containing protein [Micromonospora sp. RL09-050-HVF-A]